VPDSFKSETVEVANQGAPNDLIVRSGLPSYFLQRSERVVGVG
jgi:hypothetical protein